MPRSGLPQLLVLAIGDQQRRRVSLTSHRHQASRTGQAEPWPGSVLFDSSLCTLLVSSSAASHTQLPCACATMARSRRHTLQVFSRELVAYEPPLLTPTDRSNTCMVFCSLCSAAHHRRQHQHQRRPHRPLQRGLPGLQPVADRGDRRLRPGPLPLVRLQPHLGPPFC